jgi:hypothetical protein
MICEDYVFERKKYVGDALTAEVRQAIFDRVTKHTDHIIKYEEIQVCSVETIELFFERTNQLLETCDKCGLLINLTSTDVPDAEVRRTINENFKHICNSVDHVAFITGKKVFFNTLLKFIMFQTDLESYSVHETVDQGIEKINNLLGVEY